HRGGGGALPDRAGGEKGAGTGGAVLRERRPLLGREDHRGPAGARGLGGDGGAAAEVDPRVPGPRSGTRRRRLGPRRKAGMGGVRYRSDRRESDPSPADPRSPATRRRPGPSTRDRGSPSPHPG